MIGQHDQIEPDALAEVALALQDRAVDIVYTDEDQIHEGGQRFAPAFKPGWSPDLLLSCHYTGRLCVIRSALVEDAGELLSDLSPGREYDLILRTSELATNVAHVPKVLYHASAEGGLGVAGRLPEPDALVSSIKAIEAALHRRSEIGKARAIGTTGHYEIDRELSGEPMVSIIIPFKDGADLLERCISSIEGTGGYGNWEVLLVDNGSWEPGTRALLNRLRLDRRHRIFERRQRFNWSAINNWAAGLAKGDLLLFLNNDVEGLRQGWLRALIEQGARQKVGCVGARLMYPNGLIQHAGVVIATDGIASHAFRGMPGSSPTYACLGEVARNCSAVTGACLMSRREVFEKLGGFDESLPVAYNDIDFCLRARDQGYTIVYEPRAELVHRESSTRGDSLAPEAARMIDRWGHILRAGDPHHSSNLVAYEQILGASAGAGHAEEGVPVKGGNHKLRSGDPGPAFRLGPRHDQVRTDLVNSPDLSYLNHYYLLPAGAAEPSGTVGGGWIKSVVRRTFGRTVFHVLRHYLARHRDLMGHLVRFENETARRLDELGRYVDSIALETAALKEALAQTRAEAEKAARAHFDLADQVSANEEG